MLGELVSNRTRQAIFEQTWFASANSAVSRNRSDLNGVKGGTDREQSRWPCKHMITSLTQL